MDDEIRWSSVQKTSARSGVYWETWAYLHTPDDSLQKVAVRVTTRSLWTVEQLAVLRERVEQAIRLVDSASSDDDDSCNIDKGCDPAYVDGYEETCIDGRIRSGEGRVNDEGPCPCYCHNASYDGGRDDG